uniref:Transposase n=1 Tax=Ascaris lumbricoides TaxID=6252 RepID=A0A0M3IVW5_ASCLU
MRQVNWTASQQLRFSQHLRGAIEKKPTLSAVSAFFKG